MWKTTYINKSSSGVKVYNTRVTYVRSSLLGHLAVERLPKARLVGGLQRLDRPCVQLARVLRRDIAHCVTHHLDCRRHPRGKCAGEHFETPLICTDSDLAESGERRALGEVGDCVDGYHRLAARRGVQGRIRQQQQQQQQQEWFRGMSWLVY